MKQIEQVTTTTNRTTLICDRCEKEINTRYGSKQCFICGRDICDQCRFIFEPDCSLDEPHHYSDYPESVCRECWVRGTSYRIEINRIREEAEVMEGEQWAGWKTNCIRR